MYAFMITYCAKYNQVTSWIFGILTYLSGSIIQVIAGVYDPLKWFSPFYLVNDYTSVINGSLSTLGEVEYILVLFFVWTLLPLLIGWFWYHNRDL